MERDNKFLSIKELYKHPGVVDPKNPTKIYPDLGDLVAYKLDGTLNIHTGHNLTATVNPITRQILIACGYIELVNLREITDIRGNRGRIRIVFEGKLVEDESVLFVRDCINSFYNS